MIRNRPQSWLLVKVVLLTLVLFVGVSSCTKKQRSLQNEVVVKVNEATLTAGQFSDLLIHKLKSFNALTAKESVIVNQAKSSVVQDFIVQVITREWAQKNGLFVRREDLDEAINKIRRDYPDDLAFRKALSEEGLTYSEWEDRTRYSVLEDLVLKEIRKEVVEPTEVEISAYYNENRQDYLVSPQIRIRQIVLNSDEHAQLIRRELGRGKDFAELAEKFSITPEGQNGGEIGWVERGLSEVFDAGFRLGIGQRSQVIRSPYGHHIIEVTGRRGSRHIPLREVRDQIKRHLLKEKERRVYMNWLEKQVLDAKVFKDEELISLIKVETRG